MLNALLARMRLPATCELQGVLIAAERPVNLPATIQYFCGGHPLPNEASFAGARAALAMLHGLRDASAQNTSADDTLCIFLLSGGASAMMELPLDAAISLDDTVAFHRALVHSGASIVEMNCVRKHFSAVKGGRLALAAGRAQTLSLLVSDVPPAHLDALGSGPTVDDSTTVAECREILERYGLMERFPAPVRRFFALAELQETPKPGELNARICKLVDSDEMAEAARDTQSGSDFTRSSTTLATTGAMTLLLSICWTGCASCAANMRASASSRRARLRSAWMYLARTPGAGATSTSRFTWRFNCVLRTGRLRFCRLGRMVWTATAMLRERLWTST